MLDEVARLGECEFFRRTRVRNGCLFRPERNPPGPQFRAIRVRLDWSRELRQNASVEVRKHKKRLLAIGAICSVLFVAWSLIRSSEGPTYDGRPLRFWLLLLGSNPPTAQKYAPAREYQKAEAAIETIGINAIPVLLKSLFDPPSRLDGWASHLPDNLPGKWGKWLKKRRLKYTYISNGAERAFGTLGSNASSAIPALSRKLETSDSDWDQEVAMRVLARIGSSAVPAIQHALSIEHVATNYIVSEIRLMDAQSRSILQSSLMKNLSNTNPMIVQVSTFALGRIHDSPDLVVPALLKLLSNTNAGVRYEAVSALVPFTRQVSPEVLIAQLTNLLTDPDPKIRDFAQSLIKFIHEKARRQAEDAK